MLFSLGDHRMRRLFKPAGSLNPGLLLRDGGSEPHPCGSRGSAATLLFGAVGLVLGVPVAGSIHTDVDKILRCPPPPERSDMTGVGALRTAISWFAELLQDGGHDSRFYPDPNHMFNHTRHTLDVKHAHHHMLKHLCDFFPPVHGSGRTVVWGRDQRTLTLPYPYLTLPLPQPKCGPLSRIHTPGPPHASPLLFRSLNAAEWVVRTGWMLESADSLFLDACATTSPSYREVRPAPPPGGGTSGWPPRQGETLPWPRSPPISRLSLSSLFTIEDLRERIRVDLLASQTGTG